jgi:Tol biopolymer transport system component
MRIGLVLGMLAAMFALPAPSAAAPARIVFTVDSELWTMNADGSAAAQLTHLASRQEAYEPAWSPDGARIAFTSGGGRIWTVASDGSDARRITPKVQKGASEQSPAWSPDGSRIAFARTRFGKSALRVSIVVANADGSGPRTIVSERVKRLVFVADPAWSPDGGRLVFTRWALDKHAYFRPTLFSVAPDGSDRRRLVRDGGSASYSPDGTRIAFISVRDRNGEDCGSDECSYRGELYVMNADGSGQTRLTRTRGAERTAAWSPDGGRIAFDSTRNFPRGGKPEVYSIAPDGSCLTWLTNGNASSGLPDWEPGASLSSDPGECGAVDRPALLSVDVVDIARPTRFDPLWLGPAFGTNLLLSQTEGTYLYYEDCSSFVPKACGRPVQIAQRSTCWRGNLLERRWYLRRLRRIHGALVFSGRRGFDVYTGRTAINVYGVDDAGVRDLVAALRPFGADAPPASLPPPAFDDRVWRKAGRAVRERLRSRGAQRRHCTPSVRR